MNSHTTQPPTAVGLYDRRFEHDACGVGMVARLDNDPAHEVIERAITALENLEHRGASGADACTGDGAGILMQMPDELLHSPFATQKGAAGDYQYLHAAGTKDVPPDIALAYDAAELQKGDGANVLYSDGHVEWLDQAGVKLVLEKTMKWRTDNPAK